MRAITPDLKSTWVGTSHWHLTSRNFCPAAKNQVAARAGAGKGGHSWARTACHRGLKKRGGQEVGQFAQSHRKTAQKMTLPRGESERGREGWRRYPIPSVSPSATSGGWTLPRRFTDRWQTRVRPSGRHCGMQFFEPPKFLRRSDCAEQETKAFFPIEQPIRPLPWWHGALCVVKDRHITDGGLSLDPHSEQRPRRPFLSFFLSSCSFFGPWRFL